MITATVWLLLSFQGGPGYLVSQVSMHPTEVSCNETKLILKSTWKFSASDYTCVKSEVVFGAVK